MKNVLKSLAKNVLIPLRLIRRISNRCSHSKSGFWIWYDNINNFEQRNGRYYEND